MRSIVIRLTFIFVLHIAALALAPAPVPYVGAILWPMAAYLAYAKPNDRDTTTPLSLQAIVGHALLILLYRLIMASFSFNALVTELGVSPDQADVATQGLLRNIAYAVLGFSFLVIVGYAVFWFRILFWDRASVFFGGRATAEEMQAMMKRGGRR